MMHHCFLLLAILFFTAIFAYELHYDELFFTESLFSRVKSRAIHSTWEVSIEQGTFLKGATHRQVKSLLGLKKKNDESHLRKTYKDMNMRIPDSFEAAYKWPYCPSITTIRDQSSCGSCWAIAAVESMSDRYCTYLGLNISLSTRNLMSCCTECGNGCEGGDPATAWKYWVRNGITDMKCQPYPFPKCEHHVPAAQYPKCPKDIFPTPLCRNSCTGQGRYELYTGKASWTLSGEEDFQRELMMNGPFEVSITVYEDFPLYKSGVYRHVYGSALGGHAVRLVGWGVLNGQKYWKIANSWNSDWGSNGYILMARGVNECGVEEYGSAGSPSAV